MGSTEKSACTGSTSFFAHLSQLRTFNTHAAKDTKKNHRSFSGSLGTSSRLRSRIRLRRRIAPARKTHAAARFRVRESPSAARSFSWQESPLWLEYDRPDAKNGG